MPAPSANRTGQFDASDTDHLWKAYQSGTPYHNTTPVHGDEVQVVDDDNGLDLTLYGTSSQWPVWNATSPAMGLPSLKFDPALSATSRSANQAVSAIAPLSTFLDVNAFVIAVAFRIIVGATNDTTTPYNNEAILTGETVGIAVSIRNASGVYSLVFTNFTSGADSVVIGSLANNTNYVALFWHTGGSIYAEVHSAAGLVGSGNTTSGASTRLTDQLFLGKNYNGLYFSSIYIGELVLYNAYVAGDKSTLTTYLTSKWLGGVVTPPAPTLTTMTPSSAYANASVPMKLVGVAFGGTGLNGTGGGFDSVSGFTFTNLSIASSTAGTVDIQIVAGKAAGAYNFTFTTGGGSSTGTSAPLAFTISSPSGGGGGDTGGNVRFNVGFN